MKRLKLKVFRVFECFTSYLSHKMLLHLYSIWDLFLFICAYLTKHESQFSYIKSSASCASTPLTPALRTWAQETLTATVCLSPHTETLQKHLHDLGGERSHFKPPLKQVQPPPPPPPQSLFKLIRKFIDDRVTALLLLFVSMDTGGKVALIGCLT